MTPNNNLCEQLRHGVYSDGYDILFGKTKSIMMEGAARIERQAKEIESLTAERDELKRRLDEEFANMDATMKGWDKLCADSEREALEIESLTDERDRLRKALEWIASDLGPNAGAGAYWRQRAALTALGREWPEDAIEWE